MQTEALSGSPCISNCTIDYKSYALAKKSCYDILNKGGF